MKIKNLITYFLLSLSVHSYAQKLILEGKVQSSFETATTGKIYYTKEGVPFDMNKYVIYDSTRKYHFEMNISKLKSDSIDKLVFSLHPENQWSCSSTIHVDKILNLAGIDKDIRLSTDLMVLCVAAAGESIEYSQKRFLGNYTLKVNDTLFKVKLKENYGFNLTFQKPDENFMTEMWGSWRYEDSTSTLYFNGRLIGNAELGLYLIASKIYTFKVLNNYGKPVFELKNEVLEKD